jgi:predicted helicase
LGGDSQGTRPATVGVDENVFNIQVGVCVLIAYATGNRPESVEAEVTYTDAWLAGAFTRDQKFELATAAASDPALLQYRPVPGEDMDPLKPPGFVDTDWPGVDELLTFRSNGVVTYRDGFVYATTQEGLASRIQEWLELPPDAAAKQFKDTRDRKAGPALRVPFTETSIEPVSYRPLDRRYLYNRREYVDFPKRALQDAWGEDNIALFAVADGTGSGPATWCHALKPDQHAFRGSYGGWVFPFRNHAAEGHGHFFAPAFVGGLATAYGRAVDPNDVFDAILALVSASSYTTRFAFDLEDDFPHVPFPADRELFVEAARLGHRIREIEGFASPPALEFQTARLLGRPSATTLAVPTPQRAFVAVAGLGSVALLSDRSLCLANVAERVWRFEVSGYSVLYRWLRARNGESLAGASGARLLRDALDVVWRIAELVSLFDRADVVLGEALNAPLTRADLDLPARNRVVVVEHDDDTPG